MQRLTANEAPRLWVGFERILADSPPRALGIALSGGGDSMALLLLAHEWAAPRNIAIAAVTVDHGLRPEARAEAELAGRACARLEVPHDIVEWRNWKGDGNLQQAARDARRRLVGEWARDRGIDVIALGHTQDDQAETVLLRLLRGSGVDGLSGMAPTTARDGLRWVRPLLEIGRHELREYLRKQGQEWADDPSNDNPRFDRVRARRALATLGDLGVSVSGLADTAARLRIAREALEDETLRAARAVAAVNAAGAVEIDATGFAALPEEIRRRLMAHSLQWVGGGGYRPRLNALIGLLDAVGCQRGATLAGCLVEVGAGKVIHVAREPAAVQGVTTAPGALWDGRWRLSALDLPDGCHVAALGEDGLAQCPDWRATGLRRSALLASPALWRGNHLIAAPMAGLVTGLAPNLSCERIPSAEHYFTSILSH